VKSLAQDASDHAADIEDTKSKRWPTRDEGTDARRNARLERERVARRVDGPSRGRNEQVDETVTRLEAIESAVVDASDGIAEVSDAMDSQATSVEEVAAMVDDSTESAETVANSASEIAATTDRQRERVDDRRLGGGGAHGVDRQIRAAARPPNAYLIRNTGTLASSATRSETLPSDRIRSRARDFPSGLITITSIPCSSA